LRDPVPDGLDGADPASHQHRHVLACRSAAHGGQSPARGSGNRREVLIVSIAYVAPGNGEVVLDGPIRIRILENGTNTGHRLGLTENVLAPATTGPPQHIHREHVETFFVVSGTVRFTSGTEHADVPAGGLLTAPIGVPHTFANPDADEPATFLCTFTPDRYIDYFRELGALRPGPDGLDPAVVLGLMSRYATEPYRG
jgi:mannose-6-phosphate isomerase-like protein (cupin superfamily)